MTRLVNLTSYINHHTYTPKNINPQSAENYNASIILGSSQQQVLKRIPPHCTCFILHYDAAGCGHAKTIKQHNGEWWNLDSENPNGPNCLKPADWQLLQGHIYTMTDLNQNLRGHPFQPELYFKSNN